MDQAIEFAVGFMEMNWNNFKNDLKDVTDDELDWRPLPESNNIRALIRHLRTVEQLFLSRLEDGDNTPWKDGASIQKLTDSITHDFQQNLKEFEDLHNRFVSLVKGSTMADLKAQTLSSAFSPRPQSKDSIILGEISHIATHRGQIRTLRNMYRRAKGEKGLFLPENPTFRE